MVLDYSECLAKLMERFNLPRHKASIMFRNMRNSKKFPYSSTGQAQYSVDAAQFNDALDKYRVIKKRAKRIKKEKDIPGQKINIFSSDTRKLLDNIARIKKTSVEKLIVKIVDGHLKKSMDRVFEEMDF